MVHAFHASILETRKNPVGSHMFWCLLHIVVTLHP